MNNVELMDLSAADHRRDAAGAAPQLRGETPQPLVLASVRKFATWLEKVGYASHDPYDVWGTRYGCWARKIYYEKGRIGLPLVAPLLVLDVAAPWLPRLFLKKCRYATADAQLVLAFLNLFRLTGEEGWLKKGTDLAEEILAYSIPGYSGHCWGYPFDWQNNKGMWPRNTPFITCTPYCFEAFLALHDATGEARYLEVASSIAEFIHEDLHDVPDGPDAAAGSYSPLDHSMVINATAYRAFTLIEAAERFGRPEYRETALRHVRFILNHQREDGSWLYAVGNNAEEFIDHFHTCFVLKSLWKLNRVLQLPEVEESIRSGYAYYREHLFDADDNPKYFAIEPRFQLVRLEMYNFAEAITLGALLGTDLSEADTMAKTLARRLVEDYQLPKGPFVTRVFRGGFRHTTPFLRWPQAQLFYALTNLLAAGTNREGKIS
jgi:hypothetical protein